MLLANNFFKIPIINIVTIDNYGDVTARYTVKVGGRG